MKTPLENLRTELCSFVLLRNIANNGPLKLLRAFLDAVGGDKIEITERYCDFVSSVYEHGCDLGAYIEDSLRCDDNAYVRLYSAGRRLVSVIDTYRQGANKDIAKFADQIIALCDKWDK